VMMVPGVIVVVPVVVVVRAVIVGMGHGTIIGGP